MLSRPPRAALLALIATALTACHGGDGVTAPRSSPRSLLGTWHLRSIGGQPLPQPWPGTPLTIRVPLMVMAGTLTVRASVSTDPVCGLAQACWTDTTLMRSEQGMDVAECDFSFTSPLPPIIGVGPFVAGGLASADATTGDALFTPLNGSGAGRCYWSMGAHTPNAVGTVSAHSDTLTMTDGRLYTH